MVKRKVGTRLWGDSLPAEQAVHEDVDATLSRAQTHAVGVSSACKSCSLLRASHACRRGVGVVLG